MVKPSPARLFTLKSITTPVVLWILPLYRRSRKHALIYSWREVESLGNNPGCGLCHRLWPALRICQKHARRRTHAMPLWIFMTGCTVLSVIMSVTPLLDMSTWVTRSSCFLWNMRPWCWIQSVTVLPLPKMIAKKHSSKTHHSQI